MEKNKLTDSMITKVIKLFFILITKLKTNTSVFIFTLFISADIAFIYLVNGHVLTYTVLFLIMSIIVFLRTRNIILSFFLTTIYSFQFINPNKSYTVEVLRSIDITNIPDFDGKFLTYGIYLTNIFLIITCLTIIRNILFNNNKIPGKIIHLLIPFISSYVLFFVFCFMTSLIYSPFKVLSIVWLFQYMQIFGVALILFYIFNINQKLKFNLIYPVILASIFLQFILGLKQFLQHSYLGLAIEGYKNHSIEDYAIDANNGFFRPSGSFLFQDQLALLTLIMTVIILPFTLRYKKIIYILGILCSIVLIALTQARSIWIACFFVAYYVYKTYNKDLRLLIMIQGRTRVIIYFILLSIILSFVIIPRVILGSNAFEVGGGIPFRLELIREGVQALIENPLFGYGIGTNISTLFSLFPDGIMSTYPTNVHFAILQFALETGIIGLFFFIFPFLFILRQFININNKNKYLQSGTNKDLKFIFITGLITFSIYYFFTPHNGIIEFRYLGIILGYGIICFNINQND